MQEFEDELRTTDRTGVAVVVGDLVHTLLRAGSFIEAREVFTVMIALSPQARQGPTLPPDVEIELRSLCASLGPTNQ